MNVWILVHLCNGPPETVEVFSWEVDAEKKRNKIAPKISDADDLIIFECQLQ